MAIFSKDCPNSNQIRAARWLLGWGQSDCVQFLKISLSSLRRYESLETIENPLDHLRASIIERVKAGFENHGIQFINDENHIGVLLRTAGNSN